MIYFFVGLFIGGIASMLLYSLVVSERINELELEECEEKTAEKMFNDLDYKKRIKDGCIEFERHVGNVIKWLIEFDLEINTVYVSWSGEPKRYYYCRIKSD